MMRSLLTVSAVLVGCLCAWGPGGAGLAGAADGAIVFDFEGGNEHDFKVVEGAGQGFVTTKQDVVKLQGDRALTTLYLKAGKSDGYRMVIESPVFTLTKGSVSFLVGGGSRPVTHVAICTADGKVVFKASGRSSTTMRRVTWDGNAMVGKALFVRIVDDHMGGWGHITFDDFRATGTIDAKATAARRAGKRKTKVLGKAPKRGKKRPAPQPVVSTEPDAKILRAAIEDLIKTFGAKYPDGKAFLAELDKPANQSGAALAALQRKALLANPLVSGQPILYVSRGQYAGDHHNTATMFQTDEINTGKFRPNGGLKLFDAKTGTVRTLFQPGPTGGVRDPEVSFDGKQVVFSHRKSVKDDYHVYTVAADGSGVKQLTGAPGVFDIDPLFLADGTIGFTSSREPKYCMCNRHIMGNLFKMEADGANIHQIGKSTLHEGHSALMPDGRILYDRWEYVDRNFGDAQGLWVVNPDGTNHAVYWGNNTASPGAVLDARIIPGTTLCLAIFSSCHDRPWGAVAIIDRRLGVDGRDSVVRTWPASAIELVDRGNLDTYKRVQPKYEDPFPLSDKYFLVSRMVGRGEEMGIYLLDTFGNEVLVHADAPGCFDPMPLGARPRPEVQPSRRDFADETGVFYVQNVYIGTHMKDVKPGTIKSLRVVESPPKRSWTSASWGGQGVHCPGMNWHSFELKRILGTVPVEADGSAHFTVPADKYVYFQLLDENGMMVQSMRSGTIIQSGEKQGCVGCHESRTEDTTPPLVGTPLAMKRAPNAMGGWYGTAPRMFNFQKEVQPVFDKHCMKCHDYGKKAAKTLVLAGDRTVCFNGSYTDLWGSTRIKCIGGGPAAIQQAFSWGSHASKLVTVLRTPHNDDHKTLKLSEEDLGRITTWLDINAPYYPTYESAYPNNPTGRCPLTGGQLSQLGKLTGARFVTGNRRGARAQIAFERPELSPCLQKLDKASPEYGKALAIIQAGKAMLQKTPRGDMDGFVPCEDHRRRLAKYEHRQREEKRHRKALLAGKKVYDEGLESK